MTSLGDFSILKFRAVYYKTENWPLFDSRNEVSNLCSSPGSSSSAHRESEGPCEVLGEDNQNWCNSKTKEQRIWNDADDNLAYPLCI